MPSTGNLVSGLEPSELRLPQCRMSPMLTQTTDSSDEYIPLQPLSLQPRLQQKPEQEPPMSQELQEMESQPQQQQPEQELLELRKLLTKHREPADKRIPEDQIEHEDDHKDLQLLSQYTASKPMPFPSVSCAQAGNFSSSIAIPQLCGNRKSQLQHNESKPIVRSSNKFQIYLRSVDIPHHQIKFL